MDCSLVTVIEPSNSAPSSYSWRNQPRESHRARILSEMTRGARALGSPVSSRLFYSLPRKTENASYS